MKVSRSRLAAGSSPLKARMLGPDSVRSAKGADREDAGGQGFPGVAQRQRQRHREAAAGGFAGDHDRACRDAARQQRAIGHHGIVDRRRIWMFRRETIVDRVAGAATAAASRLAYSSEPLAEPIR